MTAAHILRRTEDGKFEVPEDAESHFRDLRPPLTIICIAGKFRTGKSFLANRAVLRTHSKTAFRTGSSTKACTKGVWAFMKDNNTLMLDTEGTSSPEATPQHDAELLAVALWLSSLYMHNSHGPIDEEALSSLSLIGAVAKSIGIGESFVAPHFLWVARDFHLQMETKNDGLPMSDDEYLEDRINCSSLPEEVRKNLVECFPMRNCVTMVRPVSEERDLQRLNEIPEKSLRPEFRTKLSVIRRIVQRAPSKSFGANELGGISMLNILRGIATRLNSHAAPTIQDTYSLIKTASTYAFKDRARAATAAAKAELLGKFPMPKENVRGALMALLDAGIARNQASGDVGMIAESAVEEIIAGSVAEVLPEIEESNQERCSAWVRTCMRSPLRVSSPGEWFRSFWSEASQTVGWSYAGLSVPLIVGETFDDLTASASKAASESRASETECDVLRLELSAQAALATEFASEYNDMRCAAGQREWAETEQSGVLRGEYSKVKAEMRVQEQASASLEKAQQDRADWLESVIEDMRSGPAPTTLDHGSVQEDLEHERHLRIACEEDREMAVATGERMQREAESMVRQALEEAVEVREALSRSEATRDLQYSKELLRWKDEATSARSEELEEYREVAKLKSELSSLRIASENDRAYYSMLDHDRVRKLSELQERHQEDLAELQTEKEKIELNHIHSEMTTVTHLSELQQLLRYKEKSEHEERQARELERILAARDSELKVQKAVIEDLRKRCITADSRTKECEWTHRKHLIDSAYKQARLEIQLDTAKSAA